MTMH
jgi:hypothetical protein